MKGINLASNGMALYFIFILFSCAGGKEVLFEQDPPFKVKKATSQNWIGGVQGGGSGTIITVFLGQIHEDMKIQELFFGEEVAKAEQDRFNIDKYVARFDKKTNRDVIMLEETKEEAQNVPPSKSPFSLEKNEVVISYMHNGELKFYKYNEVEEKPLIAYPGANPNGIMD